MTRPPRPQRGRSSPISEGQVEKLVPGGAGLVRLPNDQGTFLVAGALPGERIRFVPDRGSRGQLVSIVESSPDRIPTPCPVGDRCGGCDMLHVRPEAEPALKQAIVREALGRLAEDVPWGWHPGTPERGRTRARWHARGLGDGRVLVGYHAAASEHIIEPETCAAVDPKLEHAMTEARLLLAGLRGTVEVHAALGIGGRPVLFLAPGRDTDLPSTTFGRAERRVAEHVLAGVAVSLPQATKLLVIGDPRVCTTASDDAPLWSPAEGFAQASEAGNAVLVSRVLEACRSILPSSAREVRILELFAGSGNFTVHLARLGSVVAVEQFRPACDCLRTNLSLRSLSDRVRVVEADADAYVPRPEPDLVVLDPPRAGARDACERLAAVNDHRKPPLIYVSCDPPSLARDLQTLVRGHYRLRSLDGVDLFPRTSHVEVVAVLDPPVAERS